jgi:hypothetical protein
MLDTVEGKDQLRQEFAQFTYGRVSKVNLIVRSQLDIDIDNKSTSFEPGVIW